MRAAEIHVFVFVRVFQYVEPREKAPLSVAKTLARKKNGRKLSLGCFIGSPRAND